MKTNRRQQAKIMPSWSNTPPDPHIASLALRSVVSVAGSSGPQHTQMAAAELNTDIKRCCSLPLNLPILQAFLYQNNGYRR